MSDERRAKDPGSVWREQPEEKLTVNLEQIVNRRGEEVHSRTRWEILMSIGAAVLFVPIVMWRLPPAGRLEELGIATAIVWVVTSLYFFRNSIWGSEPSRADATAASGLEYYREELRRRRKHLRSIWLWNGPLVLACLILIAVLGGKAFQGLERLRNALPLFVLLAVWVGFGFWRRLLQAREIQREIEDLGGDTKKAS